VNLHVLAISLTALPIPTKATSAGVEYLTLTLKKGVHPKIVSERLGHSRVAVTMDVYSHVLPSMQAEVAGLLEQAVLPDKNKTSC